jgi:hypothetical protein
VSVEDLERVEMEVDRMGVAGEVDEPPDLGSVQHREEGGRVFEAGSDSAPSCDAFLTVGLRLYERDRWLVRSRVENEFAHREHRRRAVHLGLVFDQRDRPDHRAGELVTARPPEVGREHLRHASSGAATSFDANAHHLRVGQQALQVGASCPRGVGEAAVERCCGGVPEGELGSRREIGEVDQETRRRAAPGSARTAPV